MELKDTGFSEESFWLKEINIAAMMRNRIMIFGLEFRV